MPGIDASSRAKRQADAMQADGVMRTALPQHGQGCAAFGKKILGVDFNEVKGWQLLKQLAVVRVPPTYADGCGMGWGRGHREIR